MSELVFIALIKQRDYCSDEDRKKFKQELHAISDAWWSVYLEEFFLPYVDEYCMYDTYRSEVMQDLIDHLRQHVPAVVTEQFFPNDFKLEINSISLQLKYTY